MTSSFGFAANGATKEDALSLFAAEKGNMPDDFAAIVEQEIDNLPESVSLNIDCSGSSLWSDDRALGTVRLHFDMGVTVLPDDNAE